MAPPFLFALIDLAHASGSAFGARSRCRGTALAQQPGHRDLAAASTPTAAGTTPTTKRETAGMKCELVTQRRSTSAAGAAKAGRTSPGFPARDRRSERVERARAPARDPRERARRRAASRSTRRARRSRSRRRSAAATRRNYARVQERLQPFKDAIEIHEKNIEALQRELGNLKSRVSGRLVRRPRPAGHGSGGARR